METIGDPAAVLRGRAESLFGAVHHRMSDCALVQFTIGGEVGWAKHVVFAGGYRKEEGAELLLAGDLTEQMDIALQSVLEVWPNALQLRLIWRSLPDLNPGSDGMLRAMGHDPERLGRAHGKYLRMRFTAIPLEAIDIAVTQLDHDYADRQRNQPVDISGIAPR